MGLLLGEAHRGLEAGRFLAQAQSSPGRGAPPGHLGSQGVPTPLTHRIVIGAKKDKALCELRLQGSGKQWDE